MIKPIRFLILLFWLLFLSCISAAPAETILSNETGALSGKVDAKESSEWEGEPEKDLCPYGPDVCKLDFFYGSLPIDVKNRTDLVVLPSKGYVSIYSTKTRTPLLVAYRIEPGEKFEYRRRKGRFLMDPRVSNPVRHKDYTHSGFSRGHMAPAFGIHTRFGKEAGRETFFMTNVVPQRQSLNGGVWKQIEMRVAGEYSSLYGVLYVMTGPVFDDHRETLDSGVEIPDGFYKFIIDPQDQKVRVHDRTGLKTGPFRFLAYSFDHDQKDFVESSDHLVPVDDIEKSTGFDFFTHLSEEKQKEIESKKMEEW